MRNAIQKSERFEQTISLPNGFEKAVVAPSAAGSQLGITSISRGKICDREICVLSAVEFVCGRY
jgi:hypothetical protein